MNRWIDRFQEFLCGRPWRTPVAIIVLSAIILLLAKLCLRSEP